jgi:hypothetical protein
MLGWPVALECSDVRLFDLVRGLYGRLPPAEADDADRIRLLREADGTCRGDSTFGEALPPCEEAVALSWLDDQLTIGAQHRRQDLLFLHAAALRRNARAVLLLAESGGGKSTASWAAVHEGFALMSDELAPVRVEDATVLPHPRAVCLKTRPPGPWPLPEGTFSTAGGFHVPPELLPLPPADGPAPIAALVFVSHRTDGSDPRLTSIAPAEAAARLYAHSLNPLAHAGDGLDAVSALARRVPAFTLVSTDLPKTARLIASLCDAPAQAGTVTGRGL